MVMTEVLPLAHVKASLSEIIDTVATEHDRVTITRRGRPVAVLLSVEDLQGLEETLAILSDPGELAAVRAGLADVKRGDVVALEQVHADFAAHRLR